MLNQFIFSFSVGLTLAEERIKKEAIKTNKSFRCINIKRFILLFI
jgi:hypothetical protein